jgi:23S rRNA (cytidine1920-2'-O)/16S rRNA (cytidine1409-2'-O)-methyltransferase
MDFRRKLISQKVEVSLGDIKRLDSLVLKKGWADSRESALILIESGRVSVKGVVKKKPSDQARFDDLSLLPEKSLPAPFVGRGGEKLQGALNFFGISPEGCSYVDLGASTGGFTDCLIRKGASRVLAVDVGRGQLASSLLSDNRVSSIDGVNVRHLGSWVPSWPVDGVVADLSFISLRKILPTVEYLLRSGGIFLPLFKPQFEAASRFVGPGGVVRDPILQRSLIASFFLFAEESGWQVKGCFPSLIQGRKGNQEYLLFLSRKPPQ